MIEGKLTLATPHGSGRQFVAVSGSGHAVVMDDAEGHTGTKPIELALLALGGCTAFDVIGILRKKRQTVTGYEVELRAEQNPEPPKYFTRVEIKHRRNQVLLCGRDDLPDRQNREHLRDYSRRGP